MYNRNQTVITGLKEHISPVVRYCPLKPTGNKYISINLGITTLKRKVTLHYITRRNNHSKSKQ